MNTRPLLDQEAFLSLQDLLQNQDARPLPSGEQRQALARWVDEALVTFDAVELEDRVELHDRVTLVSPSDPADWFELEIVPPSEADIDRDLIPVTSAVSLAVLGRRVGERATWETQAGARVMTIASLVKKRQAVGSRG
ncbi:GreA/GreB family elongation factor [Luteolibacter ambystomatis]|uniref:GreA/GreB family elongation factor n=1 Tax=Luteolibacter ambystomatis TaxID=2824561 RepID=A0A975J2X1_9BACT|nr:GreA/GreB family elongation factor [Luteolibacter ambystomatis]QUE53039.1 GreA/GreB family elongation factor [Luteolibacter ambystomatis]